MCCILRCEMKSNDKILKTINLSGFPLQLAVEREVNNSHGQHLWSTLYREYAWSSNDGAKGFADLVLEHQDGFLRMVVECKRIKQEDLERPLIFLGDGKTNIDTKCQMFRVMDNEVTRFGWVDMDVSPKIPEVEFSIFKDSGSDKTQIDRASSELITA